MSEYTLAEKIAIAVPHLLGNYKGFNWWWDDVDPQYQIGIYKDLAIQVQSIMDGTHPNMNKLDKWIEEQYVCAYCEGTGNCQECDGEGDVGDDMGHLDCEDCDGSGECTYCEGTGKVQMDEMEEEDEQS